MKKNLMAMNLQHFAEPSPEPTPEPTKPEAPKEDVETTSPEEQLQQMRVEMAKLKKAFDKASGEAADYKKQLRAKQSEDEIALQEKAEKEAEREEKFNQLLKENTVTKYEKNYLALGYPEELATKAANAQYENDTDALFKIQSDFKTAYAKELEAEWLKNRPTPQSGTGEDGDFKLTKEEYDAMDYLDLVKLKAEHPTVYEKFSK